MKIILNALFVCSFATMFHAQTNAQIRPLSIGDKLKNSPLHLVTVGHTNIQQGKQHKSLLLDFWGTYCVTCVEVMPKLDSLQTMYKDQLQIILVTEQSEKLVKHFLEKRRQLTGNVSHLSFATDDSVLNRQFVHEGIPHYVWIDNRDTVRYVTGGGSVTNENIKKFVHDEKLNVEIDNDSVLQFMSRIPLFINQNAGNGEGLLYYSVVSGYIKNMPSIAGIFTNHTGDKKIAMAYSQSIKEIFQLAWNDGENQFGVPNSRTILNVRDTAKYVGVIDHVEHRENFYTYQLITPLQSDKQIQALMQQEVQNYFKLEAHMEKRKTKCWVLRSADTALVSSQGGKWIDNWDLATFSFTLHNVTATAMQHRFIYNILEYSPYPFADETGIKGNIDLVLEDVRSDNLDSFIQALKKYKMTLQLEDHDVDILIISEPGMQTKQ